MRAWRSLIVEWLHEAVPRPVCPGLQDLSYMRRAILPIRKKPRLPESLSADEKAFQAAQPAELHRRVCGR